MWLLTVKVKWLERKPQKDGFLAEPLRTRRMTENEIGEIVVDAAVLVHRDLGPGLLETV